MEFHQKSPKHPKKSLEESRIPVYNMENPRKISVQIPEIISEEVSGEILKK